MAAGAGRHSVLLSSVFAAPQLRRGGYRLVVQSENGRAHSQPIPLSFSINQ